MRCHSLGYIGLKSLSTERVESLRVGAAGPPAGVVVTGATSTV